jgi:hypothetical protein
LLAAHLLLLLLVVVVVVVVGLLLLLRCGLRHARRPATLQAVASSIACISCAGDRACVQAGLTHVPAELRAAGSKVTKHKHVHQRPQAA